MRKVSVFMVLFFGLSVFSVSAFAQNIKIDGGRVKVDSGNVIVDTNDDGDVVVRRSPTRAPSR